MRAPRLALALLPFVTASCNIASLNGSQNLPAGIVDPSTFNTPAGAIAMYEAAVHSFEFSEQPPANTLVPGDAAIGVFGDGAFVDNMLADGLITDELSAGNLGGSPGSYGGGATGYDSVDARILLSGGNSAGAYPELQGVRAAASQALGALQAYAPASPPAYRGRLFAYRGYAEVMLAETFCSGVPLSTVVYGGDYTYAPSSTSTQVYQAAIAQFDTARTLGADSAAVLNLARVGTGRAMLDLGDYAQAAQAVASVPDNFQYQFLVDWSAEMPAPGGMFAYHVLTVSDREGVNGLPFISSGDPRSASVSSPSSPNGFGQVQYVPVKYGNGGVGISAITVADGIEARLIEAEAALQAGNSFLWLTKLNRARVLAADTLPPLTDPGSDTARVTLTFAERAYDLFLTGHRQGDLRRLIRQYHRTQSKVFPTGPYRSVLPDYGSFVDNPIPNTEMNNPLFHGCLGRGA